jgi:thiazole/oxazole-forming peptide maturase SagD family component
MSAWRLDPAWLVGASPRGIVCTRGDTEIALEVAAPFADLVALVHHLENDADPATVARLADTSARDAEQVLQTLREHGTLTRSPAGDPPEVGVALVEAILRVASGRPVELTWTATEVLVIPAGAEPAVARRAVRWFVAGLTPDIRAEAYCAAAAHGERSVAGDRPDAAALAAAASRAREAGAESVHVVAIGGEEIASVPADEVGRLGVDRVHRLGPLQWLGQVEAGPPLAGLRTSFAAEYAIGNLAQPWPRLTRVGRGTAASAQAAEHMARAEAAERFGGLDVNPGRLRRAAAGELDSAVTPDRLHRLSPRQYEALGDVRPWEPELRLLWIEGRDEADAPCWVPAEAVHLGLVDPEAPRVVPTTSSGLAAGASRADAENRGLLELIERDAFLWNWVQRVSRERIDPSGLPASSAELAAAAARAGFDLDLVNLTLETKPVVMAVLRREDRIHVAAACRDDPAQAAGKALDEASLAASLEAGHEAPDLEPEDVANPEDHMGLYMRPEWAERAAFLTASPDVIDLGEVAADEAPAIEAVRAIGPPVLVDLTTPRTAPFHVARALVPGIVPLSFGWDREPLGVARLAEPKRTLDGRSLGADVDLAEGAPILPHPFP